MKKIILVRPKIGFGLGGAETHAAEVAVKLLERRFEVGVIAYEVSFPKKIQEKIEFYQVRIKGFGSILKHLLFVAQTKQILRKLKYDYLISFFRFPGADLFILCDPLFSFLIKQKKSFLWQIRPRYRILLHLEKRALYSAKRVISLFNLGKELIKRFYPQVVKKVFVCHRGIDFQRFNPELKNRKKLLREMMGFREEDYLILFVGFDVKRKGLNLLLKVVPKLPKKVKLLIAGKGGTSTDRIIYLGRVKEMEKLYAISDLFVLPTFYDPGAMATLEALAGGTPVITSIYDGTSEFIKEGINGYVTNLEEEDLKAKILRAMENSFDPQICYNSIKHLTWDNYVDCLISQLEKI